MIVFELNLLWSRMGRGKVSSCWDCFRSLGREKQRLIESEKNSTGMQSS